MAKKNGTRAKAKLSDGGKKSAVKGNKVTKDGLVEQIRKSKKGMQEARFGLSKEAQRMGGSRKNLRKEAARAAAQLTMLRKHGGMHR